MEAFQSDLLPAVWGTRASPLPLWVPDLSPGQRGGGWPRPLGVRRWLWAPSPSPARRVTVADTVEALFLLRAEPAPGPSPHGPPGRLQLSGPAQETRELASRCIWHVPPSTAGSRSRRATLFSGWGPVFASGRREGQGWSLCPRCGAEARSHSARLWGKAPGLASLWGSLSGFLETGEQVHPLSAPGAGLPRPPEGRGRA